MSYLDIQGHQVRLSNLDKIFWPKTGTTKGQLLEYYIKVSQLLLPHLQGRLVSMQRFPDGAERQGFYQKNCPDNAPEWVKTFTITRSKGRQTDYVLIDNLATLVWLVNLGVIEFHPWLSSIGTLDYPDHAVFDFDPMELYGIDEVRQVALGLKDMLGKMNLAGRIKTSGATGMQVFIPLEPIYTYKHVRDFVQACCAVLEKMYPAWTTMERSVSKRDGKIYLDYMQNAREQTIVSVYSVRPQELPTISAPLNWEDLHGRINPVNYTVYSFMDNPRLPEWIGAVPRQRLEYAVGVLKTML